MVKLKSGPQLLGRHASRNMHESGAIPRGSPRKSNWTGNAWKFWSHRHLVSPKIAIFGILAKGWKPDPQKPFVCDLKWVSSCLPLWLRWFRWTSVHFSWHLGGATTPAIFFHESSLYPFQISHLRPFQVAYCISILYKVSFSNLWTCQKSEGILSSLHNAWAMSARPTKFTLRLNTLHMPLLGLRHSHQDPLLTAGSRIHQETYVPPVYQAFFVSSVLRLHLMRLATQVVAGFFSAQISLQAPLNTLNIFIPPPGSISLKLCNSRQKVKGLLFLREVFWIVHQRQLHVCFVNLTEIVTARLPPVFLLHFRGVELQDIHVDKNEENGFVCSCLDVDDENKEKCC